MRRLLLSALLLFPLPLLAAPASDGWQSVRQFDLARPQGPDQIRIAALWPRLGLPFGPDMVGHSVIYADLPRPTGEVLVVIPLGADCDMGPNDAASTQLHAVCPAAVVNLAGNAVKVARIEGACYLWPDNDPPSPETDPRRNITRVRLDPASGMVEVDAIRHGKPIAGCDKRVMPPA